ncbi:hypothetical protein LOC67_23375 [Stieleria sp. JC731]|uniref:hypothetical protein n=1 Tax=Pirellulaceae TaxID=2691357 RepID=UPI001E3B41D2|nr:hypothetical protein [Stieleria sp. JC731]MCC9603501.1 hypothetical protein [Stieleria sp. JC731]
MDTYNGWGIGLKPKGASSVTILGGVSNQSAQLGTEHGAEPTAGQRRAAHSEITSISPRASVTTFDIGTMLGLIGSEGACLEGGDAEGFALYQIKHDQCGEVASGSVHRKILIPNGRIVPRSLSCSHRQNAELTSEVIATYDGTNDPVIPTASVAAPTGLTDAYRFTLGAVSVAGVTLEGNTSVEVNFGVEVQPDGGDSDLFDTHLQIVQVKPEIMITTRDVSKFATGSIPLRGLHGLHSNSSIVFRRRVNGTGDFSTSADSMELTFDGLVSVDSPMSAQGNQRSEMTIKITCLDDGTNAPLVFAFDYDIDGA